MRLLASLEIGKWYTVKEILELYDEYDYRHLHRVLKLLYKYGFLDCERRVSPENNDRMILYYKRV